MGHKNFVKEKVVEKNIMLLNSVFVICSYEKRLLFINMWICFRLVCRYYVALDQN